MSIEDISPSAKPFDAYIERLHPDIAVAAESVRHFVYAAKRLLLQDRVRDFTAADVVALATLMANVEREIRGK